MSYSIEKEELEFEVFLNVLDEVRRAQAKFKPYNSAHEGWAVIFEELDEMWDEVRKNDLEKAQQEAVQVAATAIRFLLDSQNWPKKGQVNQNA